MHRARWLELRVPLLRGCRLGLKLQPWCQLLQDLVDGISPSFGSKLQIVATAIGFQQVVAQSETPARSYFPTERCNGTANSSVVDQPFKLLELSPIDDPKVLLTRL